MKDVDRGRLRSCHGYLVIARDGTLGEVETPVFPPGWDEPDYLIVTERADGWVKRPIPVSLVRDVDAARRVVYVDSVLGELAELPRSLPLTGTGDERA
jgi:hypothetical protein